MAGCTRLSEEDRALLVNTQRMAEQAAQEVRDEAKRAAMPAEASNRNADRMYTRGQQK